MKEEGGSREDEDRRKVEGRGSRDEGRGVEGGASKKEGNGRRDRWSEDREGRGIWPKQKQFSQCSRFCMWVGRSSSGYQTGISPPVTNESSARIKQKPKSIVEWNVVQRCRRAGSRTERLDTLGLRSRA